MTMDIGHLGFFSLLNQISNQLGWEGGDDIGLLKHLGCAKQITQPQYLFFWLVPRHSTLATGVTPETLWFYGNIFNKGMYILGFYHCCATLFFPYTINLAFQCCQVPHSRADSPSHYTLIHETYNPYTKTQHFEIQHYRNYIRHGNEPIL